VIDAEYLPDQFRIADATVGSQVGQVHCLLLRARARDVTDGGGAPGVALIDDQHPMVGDHPILPARGLPGYPTTKAVALRGLARKHDGKGSESNRAASRRQAHFFEGEKGVGVRLLAERMVQ
jgi:hypothetical protein